MTRPTRHIDLPGVQPEPTSVQRIAAELRNLPNVGADTPDPARAAEQAAAVDRHAQALLADAIATAEALNGATLEDREDAQALDNLAVDQHRDHLGRYAMQPNPAQGSSGSSGVTPRQPTSPLDRIRSSTRRHYDQHVPDGYLPPAS